jgi:Zn-dependent protease
MLTIPGRIPIRIFPIFWVLVLFISWFNTFNLLGTAIWAFVIFVSVLIHEYGHALTAIAFGQKVNIDLVGFGGLTQRKGPPLKLWQDFLITFNGPLAGLLLSFASLFFLNIMKDSPDSYLKATLELFYYANIFWTIVNLLPIHPLDGGHLLRIVFEGLFGLRGVKVALFIGTILALAITILFFLIGQMLAGALFMMFTFESYRNWKNSLSLSDQDKNFALQHLLREAEKSIHKGNHEAAEDKLIHLREMTKSGVIYLTATNLLAEIFFSQARYEEAYTVLDSIRSKLAPDGLRLLHQSAFHCNKWQEVVNLGTKVYQLNPDYETASLNAISCGILGDVQPAIGWIQCAVREGLPNLQTFLKKAEFDPIRYEPQFVYLTQEKF